MTESTHDFRLPRLSAEDLAELNVTALQHYLGKLLVALQAAGDEALEVEQEYGIAASRRRMLQLELAYLQQIKSGVQTVLRTMP
ncbi:MAG: hypothetical protein H8D74_02565 [Chloroflexi bacterium]|nr:hypothetical protein [Chloroflexota bacterium]